MPASSFIKKTAPIGGNALVTGGSAGLGLAVARACLRRGMRVAIVGRDPGRLDQAAERLRAEVATPSGGKPPVVQCIAADLAFGGEPTRVAQKAGREGPLDFVCHAAGVSMRGQASQTPRQEFERLMAVNFFAAAELAAATAEGLAARRGGLALIGSLASYTAPAHLGGYPASKHALAALAQQLRMELGPKGLRTLLVCPGPITREDNGDRYDTHRSGLPPSAAKPGGGARLKTLDPDWLAERVLSATAKGKPELVVPGKARWLFVLSRMNPAWGDRLLARYMK